MTNAALVAVDANLDYQATIGGQAVVGRVLFRQRQQGSNFGQAYSGLVLNFYTPSTIPQYGLTVARAGTGTGSVTSVPAGIDCGPTCTGTLVHGTEVTLTAAADAGSEFTGWSGTERAL